MTEVSPAIQLVDVEEPGTSCTSTVPTPSSPRSGTRSMTALAELRTAYHDGTAPPRWRAGGGAVVGYVGADVPAS
jgi:hypothetical protein